MKEFKQYKRKSISEMRLYIEGEIMDGISISDADKEAGSPKVGDMIARNPKNYKDQWLVAETYFNDNLETVTRPQVEITEKEIKDQARKVANQGEFKSNFPHDWHSVNEGFIIGAKWALQHQEQVKEEK